MTTPVQTLVAGSQMLGEDREVLLTRLIERERILRSILDHAPIGIWLTDQSGSLEFVNRTFCEAIGISESDFLAAPDYAALYDPETANRCKASDAEAFAAAGPHFSEESVRFTDGQIHKLEILKVRINDDHGRPAGKLIGLSVDVTVRKQAEKRLHTLARAYEYANEGMTITDLDGHIVDVNPRFTEITGYLPEEVIGQNPRVLRSGRHDPSFYSGMWQAIAEKRRWTGEIWNRRKNGEVYPELLSISRVDDASGNPSSYIGIFFDISELKSAMARVEHMAYHDALTQLPNRILFSDRLEVALLQAKRAGHRLAVCYLDLDGFKPINDRYGHQGGDALLIEIARRLTQSLRGGDSIARIGGDEFVLLLNEIHSDDECDTVLERLLQTVAAPFFIDGQKLSVTASLGVTLFPEDDSDADTLLRHADQSLYRAKEFGKNRYHVFDTLHDSEARARQSGRQRFEAGLAAGELVLYHQPKVDMRLGRVVGTEALTRWRDPELGLVAPGQFLPYIENTPADIALGEWVIQTSLRQLQAWHRSGLDVSVSINISPYHLAQTNFVSRLKDFLQAYPDLPPNSLEIEILETAALGDVNHIATLIAECHGLGVRFALDDFGTGYSSLSYLKRLPITTLKIDQSFVRDMLHDDDDLAIVEGVIGLSQAFRRAVVAEGVETVAHGVRLLQMGCDLAQGYGIARPMPAEDFVNWRGGWKPDELWAFTTGVDSVAHLDPLMVAKDDHLRWLNAFKQCLDVLPGDMPKLPNLDSGHCRFGQWLSGDGQERFGHQPRFKTLHQDHEQLHTVAKEINALHRQGKSIICRLRLTEIDALSESMILAINALLIENSHE